MTRSQSPAPESFLPLRTELLFMLLVLARGPRHGYALLEAVEAESQGEVRILTGSLYRFVGQLQESGLIEEVAPPSHEASADERRRYYGVTRLGRDVANAEVARLRRVLALADATSRTRSPRRA